VWDSNIIMADKIYNKAVILGASSGIGAALTGKLVSVGTKVVAVARRRPLLDDLVDKYGSDMVSAVSFDLTKLDETQSFVDSLITAHPDIDCVVINAGIQRAFDFTKPEALDLASFDAELTVNYTAPAHLTAAFLPHLKAKHRAHLVYISATLGLIPGLVRVPNYNASKAALHSFIMAVRQQLKDAGHGNVRLVEVFPPAVQTELHDERHQPDLVNGGQIGMPLDPFTDSMYQGLLQGDDQFAIGPGEELLKEDGVEAQRQKAFQTQHEKFKDILRPYLK
jgi:short-subunit dehydrogenase involved in D-alanine esterification of teichoic acids